jgi:hypothetical protein
LSTERPNIVTRMCVLAGLKHALIVGAYLSLLTFPSTSSAPTIQKSMSSRETAEPKWLNPCGMGGVNGAAPGHGIPDAQLINMIVRQAHIAEAKAKTFKEEFVSIRPCDTRRSDADVHERGDRDALQRK